MTESGPYTLHASWILFLFGSYLLCSIPFGKLIGQRVAKIDITRRGSGNIGATNVARELGLKWGLLTLFLDVLKGFLPVYLFSLLFPKGDMGLSIVGLSAVLGHQFSIFQKFHGGKGVATALGIYLAISPIPCLTALIIFILIVAIMDYVSLGSILCSLVMPLLLLLFGKSDILILTSLFVAFLIISKHRDNIQRLLKGDERRWKKKGVMSRALGADPTPHQNKNR